MGQGGAAHKKWVEFVYLRDDLEEQQQLEHELYLRPSNMREEVFNSVTHATSSRGNAKEVEMKIREKEAIPPVICSPLVSMGSCGPLRSLIGCSLIPC